MKTLSLPEAKPPVLTFMISSAIFPPSPTKETFDHRARQLLEAISRMEPQQCLDAIAEGLRESSRQGAGDPVTWIVSKEHPFVPGMKIIRMFVGDGGVEVYSHDDKIGMRTLIPMSMVRLAQEAMPLDMLADEILAAEDDDDDDDDDEPDPDQTETSSAPTHEPPTVP